jgi:succinate-acetate transporter protein
MAPKETKTYMKVRPPRSQNTQEGNATRLAVVRYFPDRPGYGLDNAVARIWFHPPAICSPAEVSLFLQHQDIAVPGRLIEVYLDKFQSFMRIEACEANGIEWDFSRTSFEDPGILNIRLSGHSDQRQGEEYSKPRMMKAPAGKKHDSFESMSSVLNQSHSNSMSPALFSLSMMIGLETTALMNTMFPGVVESSFRLAWGPYMVFVGGLLQVTVGTLQVFRNNLFGAVAFLGFGTFWFSKGVQVILETHFSSEGTMADDLLDGSVDNVGECVQTLFILAFVCGLWLQSFLLSKLTTVLISLSCTKLVIQAFRLLRDDNDGPLAYMQLIVGWATSAFAFWVFIVEFTNSVYGGDVFPTWKWSEEHSPAELFGVSGLANTLQPNSAKLHQARSREDHRRIHTSMPQRAKYGGCSIHDTVDTASDG